jgi:hypothetical protein
MASVRIGRALVVPGSTTDLFADRQSSDTAGDLDIAAIFDELKADLLLGLKSQSSAPGRCVLPMGLSRSNECKLILGVNVFNWCQDARL